MNTLDLFPLINTFIFDVDGVLTDGTITLHATGDQGRTMNIKDGYALQLAVKLGYEVLIITGGKSQTVKERLQGLGIQHVYLGSSDKLDVFEEAKLSFELDPKRCLYMGDDVPDYFVMKEVGLACCPKDAAPEIQEISAWISSRNGGEGCVREIIEKVLRAQGKWFNPEEPNENQLW